MKDDIYFFKFDKTPGKEKNESNRKEKNNKNISKENEINYRSII